MKVSIPPDRIPLGRQQQAVVPRQRRRAEHRGGVSAALALRDLSVAVAGILLAVRAPLLGLVPTGQYAAFHTTSERPQPVWPWVEFTVAGGLA